MKIPISEIFESIQGEGRNTGKPSIFLRFWGCNLKCSWCDSKYSWDASVEKADMMDLDEIFDIINSFKSKHIIFTGGEPTLFQHQMMMIQEMLAGEGYSYELETNGSQELTELDLEFEQINISPKLKSSGNEEYKLKILDSKGGCMYNNLDFKFVCSNIFDTKEVDLFLKNLKEEDLLCLIDDIYIMPLGRDSKSQVNDYLIKYCIHNNYNYCLRQHLIMFGDGKGK